MGRCPPAWSSVTAATSAPASAPIISSSARWPTTTPTEIGKAGPRGLNHAVFGERNGRAKLTVDQVREIRRLRADHGVSLLHLGQRFGVSKSAVSTIIRGERWAQV